MGVATYLSLAYNVLGMLPFALFSADMVKELYPDIKAEICPRRGPCTETLEFTVCKIYLQARTRERPHTPRPHTRVRPSPPPPSAPRAAALRRSSPASP